MSSINRRNFLKSSSLAALPTLLPLAPVLAAPLTQKQTPPTGPIVKLFGDGEMFSPGDYLQQLQQVHAATAIVPDRYGAGGAVEALEKQFATITGKEKAIYMPSGTLANQLAVAVLSGTNTKVFVPDESHYYRDEADAAQSVFQKRLMPLAKGQACFTAQQLQNAIEGLPQEEVFSSGIGAVVVENPVRRVDGRMVPLEEIKKISAYCRSKNIKLHLDGARLYMASAWSGTPIKEYASYFDTVYISLYKYLGASGGAILCGDKAVIDQMPHLIKIHGGNMFGNWLNAAMALHRLEGLENRLQEAIKRANTVFAALNKMKGVKVSTLDNGTNIYHLSLAKEIDGKKLQEILNKQHNIRMIPPNKDNQTQLSVNETLLYQDIDTIINAFKSSLS
jgi:threonine aldolase